MSTIPQDMTDAAVTLEHLAKRLANEQGDGSDAAWEQATQIHAAATTLHGWADERKVKLRAAVDEDAPRGCCGRHGSYLCNLPSHSTCVRTIENFRDCSWIADRT